jgi:hypothetical protein
VAWVVQHQPRWGPEFNHQYHQKQNKTKQNPPFSQSQETAHKRRWRRCTNSRDAAHMTSQAQSMQHIHAPQPSVLLHSHWGDQRGPSGCGPEAHCLLCTCVFGKHMYVHVYIQPS